MIEPAIRYISEDEIFTQRERENFVPVTCYGRLLSEKMQPDEIGSIVRPIGEPFFDETGMTVCNVEVLERIFVRAG